MLDILKDEISIGKHYYIQTGEIVGPMVPATELVFSKALPKREYDLLATLFIEQKHSGRNGTTGYIRAWNSSGAPRVISDGISSFVTANNHIVIEINTITNDSLAQMLIKIYSALEEQKEQIERLEQKIEELNNKL